MLTRRNLILSLACLPKGRPRTSPLTLHTFPWAVDRAAHIGRRTIFPTRRVSSPLMDLTPLHLALDSYFSRPDDPRRVARARRHLACVKEMTAGESLPFEWREMHDFATILLDAPDWHPL